MSYSHPLKWPDGSLDSTKAEHVDALRLAVMERLLALPDWDGGMLTALQLAFAQPGIPFSYDALKTIHECVLYAIPCYLNHTSPANSSSADEDGYTDEDVQNRMWSVPKIIEAAGYERLFHPQPDALENDAWLNQMKALVNLLLCLKDENPASDPPIEINTGKCTVVVHNKSRGDRSYGPGSKAVVYASETYDVYCPSSEDSLGSSSSSDAYSTSGEEAGTIKTTGGTSGGANTADPTKYCPSKGCKAKVAHSDGSSTTYATDECVELSDGDSASDVDCPLCPCDEGYVLVYDSSGSFVSQGSIGECVHLEDGQVGYIQLCDKCVVESVSAWAVKSPAFKFNPGYSVDCGSGVSSGSDDSLSDGSGSGGAAEKVKDTPCQRISWLITEVWTYNCNNPGWEQTSRTAELVCPANCKTLPPRAEFNGNSCRITYTHCGVAYSSQRVPSGSCKACLYDLYKFTSEADCSATPPKWGTPSRVRVEHCGIKHDIDKTWHLSADGYTKTAYWQEKCDATAPELKPPQGSPPCGWFRYRLKSFHNCDPTSNLQGEWEEPTCHQDGIYEGQDRSSDVIVLQDWKICADKINGVSICKRCDVTPSYCMAEKIVAAKASSCMELSKLYNYSAERPSLKCDACAEQHKFKFTALYNCQTGNGWTWNNGSTDIPSCEDLGAAENGVVSETSWTISSYSNDNADGCKAVMTVLGPQKCLASDPACPNAPSLPTEACPYCVAYLTVTASSNCACAPNSNFPSGAAYAAVPDGTYRVSYFSGAARTGSSGNWNLEGNGMCYGNCGDACWNMYGTGGVKMPGFNASGYETEGAAEIACVGLSTTLVASGGSGLRVWYNDDDCGDNTGSITWKIERVS